MEITNTESNSQENVTTLESKHVEGMACPGENVLKLISGKWKPQILRLACQGAIRFSTLLKRLPGSNKQTLSIALRELEEGNVLSKHVVSEKPLHIEYFLTEKGKSMISIFKLASSIARHG